MRHITTACSLIVGLGLIVSVVSASRAADATKEKNPTQSFIKHAASGGLLEVKLGQLATERAKNPAVKQFAQRMVDDHSKANKELEAVAGQKGVQLSGKLNKKDQATFDKFADLKGEDFDREYIQCMLKDHEHDVAEFEKQARNATDQDVKTFAAKTLPTLREHLQMVRALANQK